MNTHVKINSVQEFNQFMRNLISHFENKGSKPINRKSTSTAMKTKKIESKAEIIAEFRKTARRFNSMSNSSHPSEERNRSGYDPNKVRLARGKKPENVPNQTFDSAARSKKQQIRAGKVYGKQAKKFESGYDPEKVKSLRAQQLKSRGALLEGNGPGQSTISTPPQTKSSYDPAKVRAARAKKRMEEDDDNDDLKMSYATTRGKARF